MEKYNVYIEVHGRQVNVGKIEGNSSEDACFSYAKEYISGGIAKPISVALPICTLMKMIICQFFVIWEENVLEQ
ncbi:MAG: hypothetical protein IJ703_00600 [Eubacterium sp.]|nr:hypothetical protein [Eubacterium sp.]